MVGLPATSKSYIAGKLCRYLRWLRYDSRCFAISTKDFALLPKSEEEDADSRFNSPVKTMAGATAFTESCQGECSADNIATTPLYSPTSPCQANAKQRLDAEVSLARSEQHLLTVFAQITDAVREGTKIVVFDAPNANSEHRDVFRAFLSSLGVSHTLMWVESIVVDAQLQHDNIQAAVRFSPDYKGIPAEEAEACVRKRIEAFLPHYVSVDEAEIAGRPHECYMRITDTGLQTESVNIKGYLLSKIVMFLLSLQIAKSNPIFLSRHGQSLANTFNQVGTDAPLSTAGEAYASALADWLADHPVLSPSRGVKEVHLYCSTLQRTVKTAQKIHDRLTERGDIRVRLVKWRALAEISAGIYDGLTYEEIEVQDPTGAAERSKDKLNYQYPQGESYKDVIDRLERVILEMLRCECPLIIIAHQAVIRCIYGFIMDTDMMQIPHISVPLHNVITLLPHAYGAEQSVTDIMKLVDKK
jgi:broad specificity phosphatase PhoE